MSGAHFLILVGALQGVAAVQYARSKDWPFALMSLGAGLANIAAAWKSLS